MGLFTVQGILNVAVGGLLLWLTARWLLANTDPSTLAASTMSFVFLRFLVFRKAEP